MIDPHNNLQGKYNIFLIFRWENRFIKLEQFGHGPLTEVFQLRVQNSRDLGHNALWDIVLAVLQK